MTTADRIKRDEAIVQLENYGAYLAKQEDREGVTKSGWWQDGVWLAPKGEPERALRFLEGGS